jgi:hypothetical protein
MHRQIDGTWFYEREDQLLLHESAHALIDLIMCGEPGRVNIAKNFTGGVCRKAWDSTITEGWDFTDAAYHCWGLHSACAGFAAEEIAFGSEDGCDHDRAAGIKAERGLQIAGVRGVTWGKALWVTKSWLTTYARAWRAGAMKLGIGTHSPDQMTAAFLGADVTGELKYYPVRPFLSNPTWLAEWQGIYRRLQAGV